jgi:general stress protein 26
MSSEERINQEKGFEAISDIVKHNPVAMMATNLLKIPFAICPMTTAQADPEGALWFFSDKESVHYKHFADDNRVQLLYADDKGQRYVSVYGKAEINDDRELMDKLWDPALSAWFDGKDDPGLSLLRVVVESAHFWDADKKKVLPLIEGAGVIAPGRQSAFDDRERIKFQNH